MSLAKGGTSVFSAWGSCDPAKPQSAQEKEFGTASEAEKHFTKTEADKRKKKYEDAADPKE